MDSCSRARRPRPLVGAEDVGARGAYIYSLTVAVFWRNSTRASKSSVDSFCPRKLPMTSLQCSQDAPSIRTLRFFWKHSFHRWNRAQLTPTSSYIYRIISVSDDGDACGGVEICARRRRWSRSLFCPFLYLAPVGKPVKVRARMSRTGERLASAAITEATRPML